MCMAYIQYIAKLIVMLLYFPIKLVFSKILTMGTRYFHNEKNNFF